MVTSLRIVVSAFGAIVLLYLFSDHYGYLVGKKAAYQMTPAQDQKLLASFNLNKREGKFAEACVKAYRSQPVTWSAQILTTHCSCMSREFSRKNSKDRQLAEVVTLVFVTHIEDGDSDATRAEKINDNKYISSMNAATFDRVSKISLNAFKLCNRKMKS